MLKKKNYFDLTIYPIVQYRDFCKTSLPNMYMGNPIENTSKTVN